MVKKSLIVILPIIIIFSLSKLPLTFGGNNFFDENGIDISKFKDSKTVISFSPVHTENLYAIGAGELLIGTDPSSIFPYAATKLEKFEVNKVYDLKRIVQLKPDIILVDPDIVKKYRKSISFLESRGINVINIMPKSLEEFPIYIKQLGLITGKSLNCNKLLKEFNLTINQFKNRSITDKKSVFVEYSERGYTVPAKDSLIGTVFELAGVNMLSPSKSIFLLPQDSIKVGLKYILNHNSEIDSYFTLVGRGYSGSSLISIDQKPLFKSLNSISNGKLFDIPGAYLGSYTFRLLDGIKEVHRLVYGDNNYTHYDLTKLLTRELFAKILYSKLVLKTHVLSDKNYYETTKYNHTYGSYADVTFNNELFNIIETVSMYAYILPIKKYGKEYFEPEELITKKDLGQFLYIYKDIKDSNLIEFLTNIGLDGDRLYTGLDLIAILESLEGGSV